MGNTGNKLGQPDGNAEPSGVIESLQNKLVRSSAGDTSVPTPVTASPPLPTLAESHKDISMRSEDTGTHVANSVSPLDASISSTLASEDPRTILSTLPSFPGSWNELHKVKELFPVPFDGIRATFNKGLSHHFQVSHNFTLGTSQPSGYKFGATYAGAQQLSQTETFPILTGDIDPSGNLTAQCLHAFSRNTRSRLVAQHHGGRFVAMEAGTDYRGPNCTLGVTVANPDPLAQTGICIAQCLYAVRSNMAMGIEGIVQRGMNPSLGQVATQLSGSLVGKYVGENWNSTVQISPLELGLHASYYHKLSDNQAIGVELDGRGAVMECLTTLGYSFDIPGAECTVKASVDSNMSLATTLEKKLTPLPMTLTLSCLGNQTKSQYVAGIGLSTG